MACWATVLCNVAANLFCFASTADLFLLGFVALLCGLQAFTGLVAIAAAALVFPIPRVHVAIGLFALVTGPLELWWLGRAMASVFSYPLSAG